MIYPLISVTWHWDLIDLIVTWDDSSIDESISQEILEVIFHVPQVPLGWATNWCTSFRGQEKQQVSGAEVPQSLDI